MKTQKKISKIVGTKSKKGGEAREQKKLMAYPSHLYLDEIGHLE